MKQQSAMPRRSHKQIRHTIHSLAKLVYTLVVQQEKFMATDKDLQASVDALKTAVAALQAKPPVTPLITQAQLDANTADVAAAAAAVTTAATA